MNALLGHTTMTTRSSCSVPLLPLRSSSLGGREIWRGEIEEYPGLIISLVGLGHLQVHKQQRHVAYQ